MTAVASLPQRPSTRHVNFEQIPESLKQLDQWVLWRYEWQGNKWGKVPCTPRGSYAKSNDPATWSSYTQVVDTYLDGGYSGVGLCLTKENGIVGIDIDDAELEQARPLLLDTYTERSPSETGFRQFVFGTKPTKACTVSNPEPGVEGLEVYDSGRYLTITGDRVPETPSDVLTAQEGLDALFGKYFPAPTTATPRSTTEASEDEVLELLRYLNPDMAYNEWLKVGMALHDRFSGAPEGLSAWEQWSAEGSKFSDGECECKWSGFRPGGGISWGTIPAMARQAGADLSEIGRRYSKKSEPPPSPVVDALLQNVNEDTVALAFKEQYEGQWVYIHGGVRWCNWTGTHWEQNETGGPYTLIRDLARRHNRAGTSTQARAAFVKGVETHLIHDPAFARHFSKFDADTTLLNTPEGTYDLVTNEMRPHRQGDCITKITSVAPRPSGGERFLQFLEEITDGDSGLINFHQVTLGACLSGAIEGHWLLFWYGSESRNGKNTLGDTIRWILGSYAGILPSSALMSKSNDAHPSELMNLKGKRLVVSSEVPEGSHWNEARLKETTGDTTISGRLMKQDWVEFPRTHKHLIYGNHRPQLRNAEDALKARFKIVPFNVSFLGREDPDLPQKLRNEAPYILHWLIEGHKEWIDGGKKPPICKAVDEASKDYFQSQSTVDLWLSERCRVVSSADEAGITRLKSAPGYADYSEWKKRRGEMPLSHQRWGEIMGQKFKKISSNGKHYEGVQLLYLYPGEGYD